MDSHEDEGAHTNISCWVLVGLSAAFLSARLYCKWLTRRKFWWDDYVLILAWVRGCLILYRITKTRVLI